MDLTQSIHALFDQWRGWRFSRRRTPPSDPQAFGIWGEAQAARVLHRRGWRILFRNFRPEGGGEIDLVCRDQETLVFVEVKSRRDETFGRPAAAVNKRKQRLIIRGACAWLRMLDRPDLVFRFDIVEVIARPEGTTVRILEAAYQLPDRYRY